MSIKPNYADTINQSLTGVLVNQVHAYRYASIEQNPVQTRFSVEIACLGLVIIGTIETIARAILFAGAFCIHAILPEKTAEEFRESVGQLLCFNMLLTAVGTETAFLGLYYNLAEDKSDFVSQRIVEIDDEKDSPVEEMIRPKSTRFFAYQNLPTANLPSSIFNSPFDFLQEHGWLKND